jgi:hypothetical protein
MDRMTHPDAFRAMRQPAQLILLLLPGCPSTGSPSHTNASNPFCPRDSCDDVVIIGSGKSKSFLFTTQKHL